MHNNNKHNKIQKSNQSKKYLPNQLDIQDDFKVTPYCGSLHPLRYCDCQKVPHYAERGNLASYKYLGE